MQNRCSYSWYRLLHPRRPQCIALPVTLGWFVDCFHVYSTVLKFIVYFRKNRDDWSKKDKQADLRWKWHNWSKRENRLMVVTVWTFYISLPHLPPLTDVTVHSFHNPPVLKIWPQCTFIFTIFGIKNAFSLLVECSYCAFIPSFKKSIDLLFEFGLGVWINLFHNIFQPKIFCIYIFSPSPLPIIVGSFSEFFVFITICMYVNIE